MNTTPSRNATKTAMMQSAYLYGDKFKFELVVQLDSHKLFHPFSISQIDIITKQPICNKISFSFCAYLVLIFCYAIEKVDIHINTIL